MCVELMDNRLFIANCISLGSSLFTIASCWSKNEKRIYLYQVGQCFILAIAYIFFDSYAGIVTLGLCSLRNLLLAYNKVNVKTGFALAAGMLVFGALLNNNGAVGWIVIVANVGYTIVALFAKNELLIKINIIIDLSLWVIFEVIMRDVPSLVADVIGIGVAIVAICRYIRTKRVCNEEHCDNVYRS